MVNDADPEDSGIDPSGVDPVDNGLAPRGVDPRGVDPVDDGVDPVDDGVDPVDKGLGPIGVDPRGVDPVDDGVDQGFPTSRSRSTSRPPTDPKSTARGEEKNKKIKKTCAGHLRAVAHALSTVVESRQQ